MSARLPRGGRAGRRWSSSEDEDNPPQVSHSDDPGELLAFVDARAREVPLDIAPIERDQLGRWKDLLGEAVRSLDAILARVPEGAARVPIDAFTSTSARAEYDFDPARFERSYLAARREDLAKRRARLIRRMGQLADPAFHARNDAFFGRLVSAARGEVGDDGANEAQREARPASSEVASASSSGAAFARVLAAPGSHAARMALLNEWKASGDPRAPLLEDQLAFRENRLRRTLGVSEEQALYRRIQLATAKQAIPPELRGIVDAVEIMRGLVAAVTLCGEQFPIVAPKLFSRAPIQHVRLTEPLGDVAFLFTTPALDRLTSLTIHGVGAAFGDAGALAVARCRYLVELRWLALTSCDIGEAGVEALAASPYLRRASYVGLAGNRLDPTPFASDYEGIERTGRPPLAEALERAYGSRPWLTEPDSAATWPPDRDDLAIGP
jgi:hypothetical protein